MRCKNCNIEIAEDEVFCNDCKKKLKKSSSKTDVKELEKLIEDQRKLNDLEDTKELVDLEKLVQEEIKETETIEEKPVVQDSVIEEKTPSREERNKKKSKKKLIIIIISIISILIIGLVITLVLLNNKDQEEEKVVEINYKKVIKEYGISIENIIKDYIKDNNEVPNWQQVSELITYNKYEVVCEVHNIYSDGSIYINKCKVNDKEIKHSFGEEKEEIKEGKKIDIYKQEGEYINYTSTYGSGFNLAGTITCQTENCDYISAYDKYVIIKEENQFYLYNYEIDTMEFGPFSVENEDLVFSNFLSNINTLYGIFYNVDGKNNIYNVKTGKTLKNISGSLVLGQLSFDPSIMYKYDYVLLSYKDKINFVNLKTGNTSFSIKENIGFFVEDSTNNIMYITAYEENSNLFKIYNSNGKLLFDGQEYSKIKVNNGNLTVANDKKYSVYDSELNLKTSKEYDKLLDIYENYFVVIDNNNLKILNLDARVVATFEDEWDSKNYYFQNMISGWNTKNGKEGIYLIIENKKVPSGTLGSVIEYYYIPKTGEMDKVELESIN